MAGKQCVIYGDLGYSVSSFMELLFQGSNLSAAQRAFNQAMYSAIVTAQWVLKAIKL